MNAYPSGPTLHAYATNERPCMRGVRARKLDSLPLTHASPMYPACRLAGSVSHETRQFIHLKVDTYHIVLWKSKDTPFHVTD